jgi:hypothetical protein
MIVLLDVEMRSFCTLRHREPGAHCMGPRLLQVESLVIFGSTITTMPCMLRVFAVFSRLDCVSLLVYQPTANGMLSAPIRMYGLQLRS